MVKQRSIGPDNLDDGSDASSAFLDALRTRAMDDLHLAALEYGIIMKDLGTYPLWTFGENNLLTDPQPSSTGNSRVILRRQWTS